MVTIKVDEKIIGRVCDGALGFGRLNAIGDVNHVLAAVMAGRNAEQLAEQAAKEQASDPKPVPVPHSIVHRLKGKK